MFYRLFIVHILQLNQKHTFKKIMLILNHHISNYMYVVYT